MVSAMLSELTLNLLAARLQEILAPSLILMLSLHFGWAYLRSRSSGEARKRVFAAFAPVPVEFRNTKLLELEAREKELKSFRQSYRVSAPGYERLISLADWMIRNDIPVKDVKVSGDNFDLSKPGLKDRNYSLQRKISAFLGLLFMVVSISFLSIVSFGHVVASFDDSSYFYINSDEVKFSWSSDDKLNALTCKDPIKVKGVADASEFPLERVQAICDSFGSGEVDKWVAKNISTQRSAAVFLSLIFALPIYQLWFWMTSVDAAIRIRRRLNSIAQNKAC